MTLQLSIREAKARFAEATAAAARGERVIVTRHGTPFVELVPATKKGGMDFDRLDKIRKDLGIEIVENAWPDEFDDPAFSRAVLGLDG